MSYDRDSNYISVKTWMFLMFVTAIPIVGQILVLVLAFVGENESRKNYFRAILMWMIVLIGLVVVLAMLGNLPSVTRQLQGPQAP